METTPAKWDNHQRHSVRTLAVSVHELAQIQRENGDPSCAATYREALDLGKVLDDKTLCAVCAFSLGLAYEQIADLRDLDLAERWYRESLDLRAPGDRLAGSRALSQLGSVALERFVRGGLAKHPAEELARYLEDAAHLSSQALEMTPETDIIGRGAVHNSLGIIYQHAGSIDRALHHFGQGIRYNEEAGDIFHAGLTRENGAITLLGVGRLDDAGAYAEAALANFRTFGDRAAANIQKVENLIAKISQAQAKQRDNT
jgi:tetratricopeptide (TPR) repeat protein